MKRNDIFYKTCLMLIVALALSSCTAPIHINTRDSEPVIVIYGLITDVNQYHVIRVTCSSPYFDKKTNEIVSDADVIVKSSDGDEYRFLVEKDGYYVSERKFAGKAGCTYYLTVSVDFDSDGVIDKYEAEMTIPPAIPVDSVDIKPINIMGYRHFALNYYMQEPPETDNYYLCIFYINDSLTNNKISEFLFTDDRMYNGEYIDGATMTYFEDITDEKNLTGPRAEEENNYMVRPGDELRVQLLNIEKGYYNFVVECVSEKYGENPFFGGPPSNISTNISNGAVGYFTGYCVQECFATVP